MFCNLILTTLRCTTSRDTEQVWKLQLGISLCCCAKRYMRLERLSHKGLSPTGAQTHILQLRMQKATGQKQWLTNQSSSTLWYQFPFQCFFHLDRCFKNNTKLEWYLPATIMFPLLLLSLLPYHSYHLLSSYLIIAIINILTYLINTISSVCTYDNIINVTNVASINIVKFNSNNM